MIEPRAWVPDVLARLKEAFGDRLLFLGLQGSYRRGEATETSDIDLVVLLDAVSLDDLDAYRAIVHAMPEGDKACGFICGVDEFGRWPRHELFPFRMDTDDVHGNLDDFMPEISREDVQEGAKIGASTLLHMLTHSYLYADATARPAILKDACKGAFFVMQVTNYLKTGVYQRRKSDLAARTDGAEKEILEAGADFPAWLSRRTENEAFGLLLDWCREVLQGEE